MSIDSVVSIGWDALKFVVVPIKRQFGYVISSKSYAQDLQKEVGKLAYEAEMVRNEMEAARNNRRNVFDHVTQWRANAEEALKEARDLLEDFEKASKTCCYGSLPEPSCRYQFSWKAKAKIEGIQRLTQEYSQLTEISFSDPATGNVAASTPARREDKDVVQSAAATAFASSASTSIKLKEDDIFTSRKLVLQDITAALADNSNSVVGIHGMGGVGKSTLLVDAEKRIRKEKSFDWIAKADVSENPDIKRIQGEIADALGLRDIKEKETVSGRAKLLHERLVDEERAKKKVLIILDNLWERLDLKSVGIPCGHDNKVIGCKLLLTSRFQDLLRREMGCDREFYLGVLQEEEAKTLFQRTVGKKVHEDPFKSLVDEALNKCAGFPFLIIAMANIFKDAHFPEWKDVLRQIGMSTNNGISGRINEMLRLTCDRFKGDEGVEVKSLLRLCVVYGVSKPSLENLVRYAVGLRLFQRDSSMEEVRDRLSSLIQTLKASSLLLVDDEDVDGFKIHDLVRGFVALDTSRGDPFLVLKDNDNVETEFLKDKLKRCTGVCFPYVDMESLPKKLDCSELRMFLLFANDKSLCVTDSLFDSMMKLMVLNLTGICLTRLALPFQLLENLRTLCLDDCWLEDVSMLGMLKSLQILSFVGSKIRRLPEEIGQLVELRLLDLNFCSQLEMIEPGVLGNLIKLEELYMENSFDQWNVTEQTPPTNASLIELNHMENLHSLHVSVPSLSMLPEDLNVKKLTEYKIKIGNLTYRWSNYKGSRTLELKSSDVLEKGCIQSIFGEVNDLLLGSLDGIKQSICALSQEGFPQLKHLEVMDSPSVRYIHEWSSLPAFIMLETLLLSNLINLEKICRNHISTVSFRGLKIVRATRCDKMEVLFPGSLVRQLLLLEEIEVDHCKLMRGIIEVDDYGKLELPKLRVLKLCDLPNIKSFFTDQLASSSWTSDDQAGTQIAFFNGQQVVFPSLEELEIRGMDNIERILGNQLAADCFHNLKSLHVHECNKLKCVWDKKLHCRVKFQSLRFVSISRCEGLTSLFPALVARDLTQLEELEIDGCGIVELIENEQGVVPRLVLPQLTSLKLKYLPELKCIYTGTHALHWPALKTLEVHGCNKVEIFASQPDKKMPLHKQPLFLIEKGGFPNLQELKLDLSEHMAICHGQEFLCKLRVLELHHVSIDSAISTCHFLESITNLEELVVCQSYLEKPSKYVEAMEGPSRGQRVVLPFSRHIQHLKTLDVSHCDGLSNIFTPAIAGNLVALTRLRISNCRRLTEVISDEGSKEGHVVAFNQLKYLELDKLIGLRCFSSGDYMLTFPLLEDFIVTGCPNMKLFSKGLTETLKLKGVKASSKVERWNGNINVTIQNMSKEMVDITQPTYVPLDDFVGL